MLCTLSRARLTSVSSLLCFALFAISNVQIGYGQAAATKITAQQIIERIQDHTGGHDSPVWTRPTVDTFKAGDPRTPITGIATTFTPAMKVLEYAAAHGENLIITHEPTFYNHRDETGFLANDPVYLAKQAFIRQHHLVVWRFHDHWHNSPGRKDGIITGMAAALDWKRLQSPVDQHIFVFPETSLAQLAANIKDRLHIRTLRVVGDPRLRVTRVAFLPGAAGEEEQIKALNRGDVQVLVAGEAREWETVLYAVDAAAQGKQKALILMGHDASEEAGMKECARWLKTFVPEVPIEFVPAGEPFWAPQ